MSIAFVLGGLVVAGVFAFVYLQKKKKEQGQNNANTGEGAVNPSFGITDDNSSSGTSGTGGETTEVEHST